MQRLARHLHHGLNLRVHVKDALLALPLLTLRHKIQLNYHFFSFENPQFSAILLSHLFRFRWFSNGPHLHGVHGEVLLSGKLRAAVRGALWPCSAVPPAEVAVQPQTEVAVLTAHPLAERRVKNRERMKRRWNRLVV